jgi:hypothetical protein
VFPGWRYWRWVSRALGSDFLEVRFLGGGFQDIRERKSESTHAPGLESAWAGASLQTAAAPVWAGAALPDDDDVTGLCCAAGAAACAEGEGGAWGGAVVPRVGARGFSKPLLDVDEREAVAALAPQLLSK